MPKAPEHPIFARFYDRMLVGIEEGGLAEMRRSLLAGATGRTLELGAGTGHNLAHYPAAVTELVMAEPDPHMASRLRARVETEGSPIERVSVSEAPAEELPYDDDSFDTVVSTLVLCTVADPGATLTETRRVLSAGGQLLFCEHVRHPGRARAWVQDRLVRPWAFFAGGCHPNRPSGELIGEAGFQIVRLDSGSLPKAVPWMQPLIRGAARRP